MKTITTFLILFLISIKPSFSQFVIVSSGVSENLYDISFPSKDTGYIAGGGSNMSIILKTTNGGNNWSLYTNSTTSWLYGIHFINNNIGYACGYGGVIYKTIDGGNNWSQLNTGTSQWIMSIYFSDVNTGYCVGLNGVILKTTDGGNSWIGQTSNSTSWLLSTFFTDQNTGYAAGTNATLLKTSDGGTTWNSLSPNTSNTLSDVFFINDSVGFCTGFNGTIIKTLDYGNTWNVLNSNTSVSLQSVHFFDGFNGYVVGDGPTILKTADAGNTWVTENSPSVNDLNEAFITDDNIILVGDAGTILIKGSTTMINTYFNLNNSLYPNPAGNSITIESKNKNPEKYVLKLINIQGQEVLTKNVEIANIYKLDLSNIANGIYTLTLQNSKEILVEKVVIQR